MKPITIVDRLLDWLVGPVPSPSGKDHRSAEADLDLVLLRMQEWNTRTLADMKAEQERLQSELAQRRADALVAKIEGSYPR